MSLIQMVVECIPCFSSFWIFLPHPYMFFRWQPNHFLVMDLKLFILFCTGLLHCFANLNFVIFLFQYHFISLGTQDRTYILWSILLSNTLSRALELLKCFLTYRILPPSALPLSIISVFFGLCKVSCQSLSCVFGREWHFCSEPECDLGHYIATFLVI